MSDPIPIIDLFAGPGGLNEGFSRVGEDEDAPRFTTIGSFEMERSAIKTLRLRAVYRHLLRNGGVPDSYYSHIRGELTWEQFLEDERVAYAHTVAEGHVHQVELGSEEDESETLIRTALKNSNADRSDAPWVLIGGPPCQAYSLAGRSRRANDESFAADKKHFLYREYLRIIHTFAPPVFVMENVKGLLSSKTEGAGMFEKIMRDLRNPGEGLQYDVHSLVVDAPPVDLRPGDFVIQAERYGIPQKRHRVILLGVRRGYFSAPVRVGRLSTASEAVTVNEALEGLPPLRSGITPRSMDSQERWELVRAQVSSSPPPGAPPISRGGPSLDRIGMPGGSFGAWVVDPNLHHVIQHETRNHMVEDLKRYRFAASRALEDSVSPKLGMFPAELQPNHRNASDEKRPFEDRFRVQVGTAPSTTVVSHISKDGHYYIHPDPDQMRSFTVREAARIQTFPDNYYFVGNRTQQYHQVGNAVPPLLANQIATVVSALFREPRN